MPQQILCNKCGVVLYEGMKLKPTDEIIQGFDCKCPKCGRMLHSTLKNFEVRSIDLTKESSQLGQEKDQGRKKKL